MNICLECRDSISRSVFYYSVREYGVPLCIEHQHWVRELEPSTTVYAIRLYFSLKSRGVPAKLEKFDGIKHIDIAILEAKVNIEVDGLHHNYDPKQALADLKRTYYSFKKGYFTIRIPNSLIEYEEDLEETTDYLVRFINESLGKKYNQRKYW